MLLDIVFSQIVWWLWWFSSDDLQKKYVSCTWPINSIRHSRKANFKHFFFLRIKFQMVRACVCVCVRLIYRKAKQNSSVGCVRKWRIRDTCDWVWDVHVTCNEWPNDLRHVWKGRCWLNHTRMDRSERIYLPSVVASISMMRKFSRKMNAMSVPPSNRMSFNFFVEYSI